MAVYKFESPFALIFNLDRFTGGFEREFCAYVTGATGECGVGREMAELYREETGEDSRSGYLSDRTDSVADDNGCHRPVSIYHDPLDVNRYESIIIFFSTQPDDEQESLIVYRAQKFCEFRPDWKSYMGPNPLTLKLKSIKLIANKVVRVQEVLSQIYPESS